MLNHIVTNMKYKLEQGAYQATKEKKLFLVFGITTYK